MSAYRETNYGFSVDTGHLFDDEKSKPNRKPIVKILTPVQSGAYQNYYCKNFHIMEKNKRIYIVSFGDSAQYRLEFEDIENTDAYHHSHPLDALEKELNAFLAEKFPNDTFTYYTSPKVTEIDPSHADMYSSYPLLDSVAIEEIKKILVTEVQDMDSLKVLNNNAPYDKH